MVDVGCCGRGAAEDVRRGLVGWEVGIGDGRVDRRGLLEAMDVLDRLRGGVDVLSDDSAACRRSLEALPGQVDSWFAHDACLLTHWTGDVLALIRI